MAAQVPPSGPPAACGLGLVLGEFQEGLLPDKNRLLRKAWGSARGSRCPPGPTRVGAPGKGERAAGAQGCSLSSMVGRAPGAGSLSWVGSVTWAKEEQAGWGKPLAQRACLSEGQGRDEQNSPDWGSPASCWLCDGRPHKLSELLCQPHHVAGGPLHGCGLPVSEGTDPQWALKVGDWWDPECPELSFRKMMLEARSKEH